MRTYKLFYSLYFSPPTHYGIPRNACKCEICTEDCDLSIVRNDVTFVSDGDKYGPEFTDKAGTVKQNYFIVDDFSTAYNCFESNFVTNGFSEENYFRIDEQEFTDGPGDVAFSIEKIEIYDINNELIETVNY
jgi:hypothetical protein